MATDSNPRDPRAAPPTIELVGPDDLATTWVSLTVEQGEPGSDRVSPKAPDRSRPPRYELLERIGVGAMGTVFRAKDRDLRRVVAFKTVNEASRLEVTRRLLTEVQVTAQLDHPGVVPVYGLEHAPDGGPAYTMKLVQGQTLTELLATARAQLADSGRCDRQHDLRARLEIFLRICEAIAYAHSKGVVHRDLKPPNVMVGQFGEVYVMDWGIARVMDEEELSAEQGTATLDLDLHDDGGTTRTRAGTVFGTPAYMAPEQARGEPVTPSSDIFSLGLLLYELVLLRRAFRSRGTRALMEQARAARLDPPDPQPGARRPPAELLAITSAATQLDPADRYARVEDLARDVSAWLRGDEVSVKPDGPVRALTRWMVHHQQLAVALVAGTIVALTLALVAVWAVQQQRLTRQAIAAEAREARITSFVQQVGERGRHIDSQFQWVEGQLEALAHAAEYAFSRGTPVRRPTFSAADYADPRRAPAGLVPSSQYGKPIHPVYAVYTVAPGIDDAVWRPDLALADGLRELLTDMLLDAAPGSPPQGDRDDASWIAERGNPLVWVYVAIERSGLMYMSPGARGWDERYDPRTRPWYKVNLGEEGNVWGTPYVDLMGTGRLLSATRPMHLPDGSFLGVAGVDLQFEQVVDRLVAADALPGYRTAYLVDRQGRVMVESAARDREFIIPASDEPDDGIDFGQARRPQVRAAARAGSSGYAELEEGEETLLVSWYPVPSVDWIYVVETDLEGWLADDPQPGEERRIQDHDAARRPATQ